MSIGLLLVRWMYFVVMLVTEVSFLNSNFTFQPFYILEISPVFIEMEFRSASRNSLDVSGDEKVFSDLDSSSGVSSS
jgi:hypothetical protein